MVLFNEKYPISDFEKAQHKNMANDQIRHEQSGISNDSVTNSDE